MTKNKKLILFIAPFLIALYVALKSNLIKDNFSGLSSNIKFYLMIIVALSLMSFNFYEITSKILNKRFAGIFTFCFVFPSIFPYNLNSFTRNMHILIGYVCFVTVNIIIYKMIRKTQNKTLENQFLSCLTIIAILFTAFLSINSIIELFYLFVIDYIFFKLYYIY